MIKIYQVIKPRFCVLKSSNRIFIFPFILYRFYFINDLLLVKFIFLSGHNMLSLNPSATK